MRKTAVVVFLVGLLAGPAPLAVAHMPADLAAGSVHISVSTISEIDLKAGFLVVKLDDGGFLRLVVDEATGGDDLATLEPGDVIREECAVDEAGVVKARKVLLVRPAWMWPNTIEF